MPARFWPPPRFDRSGRSTTRFGRRPGRAGGRRGREVSAGVQNRSVLSITPAPEGPQSSPKPPAAAVPSAPERDPQRLVSPGPRKKQGSSEKQRLFGRANPFWA